MVGCGQLLALARSEPGRTLELQEIDLTELAQEVSFEMLSLGLARSKGIDLGFEGKEPVRVHGERILLRELLTNLVHNAIVYTPPQGRVTVIVGTRQRRASLQVVDNGPGIPAAERARVLERFYRMPGATEQGSGLGLAIVQEICARHGIELALADAPDGSGGLCVDLTWPAPIP